MAVYRGETLAFIGICFFFFVVASLADPAPTCDKSSCPGPLKYYKEIGCKPVYKNAEDCCAERYNCSHLNDRSAEKCYYYGHEYEIGEKLRDEDAKPCDIGCFCSKGYRGIAEFTCASVDCFGTPKPGCYMKNSPNECCPGPEVCPKKPEDRPKCIVDGETYLDGEYFKPKSDPEKYCYCMEGYAGENVAPFCKTLINECGTEMHATSIHEMCAPVYYYEQSPKTSCSLFSRCQNNNDMVIHNHGPMTNETGKSSAEISGELTCTFGNMTMHLGDELNQATHYDSVCVKCVCEVPPVPTCQRLSDTECDVTKHQPFD